MVDIAEPRERAVWAALLGIAASVTVFLPRWVGASVVVCAVAIPFAWWILSKSGRWLIAFFIAALLLPPLPIALGDTGPHPALLIAALGAIAGLIRLDQWRGVWRTLDGVLLGFVLVLALSVGFASVYSGPMIAAGSAARVVLLVVGVYVYFAVAHGPEREMDVRQMTRALFSIAVAAALFGCVDFVYQLPAPAGFEPQFLWLESGVYRRAQGLFYESSTLGNFCSFFIVFAAVVLAEHKSRRLVGLRALGIGVVVFSAALLLSFSRASVIACLLSLAVLGCLERERWLRGRSALWILGLACLALALFAIAIPEVAEGYWGRLQLTFERIQDAPDSALSGRLESWGTVLSFVYDHPLQTFFGIGYKTQPYTNYLGRPVIADNMYLSVLVETGMAGLLALVGLNLAILATAWRAMRAGSLYGKWLLCFWVGESAQMLSGDILTYWRVLPLYFWLAAVASREGYRAHSAD